MTEPPNRLAAAMEQHRSGRLSEAEQLYRTVLAHEPDDPDALHYLGILAQQVGRPAEAVTLIKRALIKRPNDAMIYFNLGHVFRQQGQIQEALSALKRAAALRPEDPTVNNDLAGLYHLTGQLDPALKHYRATLARQPKNVLALRGMGVISVLRGAPEEAVPHLVAALSLAPEDQEARKGLLRAFRQLPTKLWQPEWAEILTACFGWSETNSQHLAILAAEQIKRRHSLDWRNPDQAKTAAATLRGEDQSQEHADFFQDPLVWYLLVRTVNLDGDLEIFFTALRRCLLLGHAAGDLKSSAQLRFVAALALQAFNNGYVFLVEDPEPEALETARREITRGLADSAVDPNGLTPKLLIFALYEPLSKLETIQAPKTVLGNTWPAEILPLLEVTLVEPMEELAEAAQIPSLGEPEDSTSRLVQAQYEESPYPRWLFLEHSEPDDFGVAFCRRFPHISRKDLPEPPYDVLVAGCGSGLQPLALARSYRDQKITALDLSTRSLAYARRMARRFGIGNVEFFQGDILQLATLGRRFSIIECSGVLHHMADPEAGLRVLLEWLKPGGLIKIGLYSRKAREILARLRRRFELSPDKNSAEAIRAFRRRLLEVENGGAYEAVCRSVDFNNLYGCRDLLFHPVEHEFTLPQVREMFARHGLHVIGFDFMERTLLREFRNLYPGDPSMKDFKNWADFEERRPEAFTSMYRIWSRKSRFS